MNRWTLLAIALLLESAIFIMVDPAYIVVIGLLLLAGFVAFWLLWIFDPGFRDAVSGEVRQK